MKNTDLEEFGLDKNQSTTYISLLEIGPASILELSKKSGVNRTMLYEVIDSLISLGLVYKSVRGKKTRFIARDPSAMRLMLSQKVERFEKILPGLKTLVTSNSFKPAVTLHDGLKGIKQVYLTSANSKEKKLYAFVGVESLLSRTDILEEFWDEEFKNERKKYGVFGQLLVPNNAAGRKFKAKDNQNFRESRLVDTELYNFPAEVLMYDDRTVFVSYTLHEEYAIEIRSPAITETLEMTWRFMWEAHNSQHS